MAFPSFALVGARETEAPRTVSGRGSQEEGSPFLAPNSSLKQDLSVN